MTFVDRQNGHVVAACDGSGAVAIGIIALLPAGLSPRVALCRAVSWQPRERAAGVGTFVSDPCETSRGRHCVQTWGPPVQLPSLIEATERISTVDRRRNDNPRRQAPRSVCDRGAKRVSLDDMDGRGQSRAGRRAPISTQEEGALLGRRQAQIWTAPPVYTITRPGVVRPRQPSRRHGARERPRAQRCTGRAFSAVSLKVTRGGV